MPTEEERKEKIKQAFFQYAQEHELPNINTPSYYARQFLPDESFLYYILGFLNCHYGLSRGVIEKEEEIND